MMSQPAIPDYTTELSMEEYIEELYTKAVKSKQSLIEHLNKSNYTVDFIIKMEKCPVEDWFCAELRYILSRK